jgi:Cdc6-like AAA superfamily ATPase
MTEDAPWDELSLKASQVFSPGAPINERDLFSGRKEQIWKVVDAVNQSGLHAIIFGDRGVGKTSLSRVIKQYLSGYSHVTAPSVNCETSDTFESVWKKVFNRIDVSRPGYAMIGWSNPARQTDLFKLSDVMAGQTITAEVVRDQLEQLATYTLPVVIIDEFDRLQPDAAQGFADTIKSLSDYAIGATVILVGVGDSVDQLIEDHRSVGRALKQILMPRMTPEEISTILTKGLDALGMTIAQDALDRVVLLARGLPHYAHLLGLTSARAALETHSLEISVSCVNRGIETAIEESQQSIQTAYRDATHSTKPGALFKDVLLACALADADERGFFAPVDVRKPLRLITGAPYEIQNYAQHLSEFSSKKRGHILRREKDGGPRSKYRFADPLMQPYVIMQGLQSGKISEAMVDVTGSFSAGH